MRDLITTIIEDLETLGISINNTQLVLKPYSKTLYACYRAKTDKIYLYVYQDEEKTKIYSYEHYLTQVIHEMCHVIQYFDPEWERKKGIMHDSKFWEMFNFFLLEAKQLCCLFNKEVIVKDGKFFTRKKNES